SPRNRIFNPNIEHRNFAVRGLAKAIEAALDGKSTGSHPVHVQPEVWGPWKPEANTAEKLQYPHLLQRGVNFWNREHPLVGRLTLDGAMDDFMGSGTITVNFTRYEDAARAAAGTPEGT